MERTSRPMAEKFLALAMAAILAAGLAPSPAAYADEASDPVIADGTAVTVDRDVNVTEGATDAVKATNGADVTVNGDVTASSSHVDYAVNAVDSTVTVDGDVVHDGGYTQVRGGGVYAENSTVTVGGITTEGSDDDTQAIVANSGSTVVAGDIRHHGAMAESIFATESTVTAGDVSLDGDQSWAVHAINGSEITLGNVVNDNIRYGGGLLNVDDATITAESVTVHGLESTGVSAGAEASPGSAPLTVVKGDVTATGKDGNGVELSRNAVVTVGGNVTAKLGYGAVFNLFAKDTHIYYPENPEASTLVVEGALSGSKAPLALVADRTDDGVLVLDPGAYDLPTVIVKQMAKGEKWICILTRDEDDYLVELTGPDADALADAMMRAVRYIVDAKGMTVDGAATSTVNGKAYTVAHEGDVLTLSPIVGKGQRLASLDLGSYADAAVANGDGTYTITAARGGDLVFSATAEADGGGKVPPANGSAGETGAAQAIPQTGDAATATALAALIALAACAGALVPAARRRKDRNR